MKTERFDFKSNKNIQYRYVQRYVHKIHKIVNFLQNAKSLEYFL